MNYFKSLTNNYITKSENEIINGMVQITESEYNQLKEINKQKLQIKSQIAELKRNLANTDYQAIKYAEGQLTEQEYASMKAQRQAWRDEINQLEQTLA